MVKDVKELLRGLYGLDVEFIARAGCNGSCYPVVLEAEGGSGRVELRVKSSTEVEVAGGCGVQGTCYRHSVLTM